MSRSKTFDIMKGIGIILVVIGHCDNIPFFHRFIYLFHLALFFAISGYFYKENYAYNSWDYIGKLLKKYMKYFVIYTTILVLGRNIFIHMGIMDNAYPTYRYAATITGILNSFIFINTEPFSGAMWFIPVLLVSLVIFNFITNYSLRAKTTKQKELLRFAIILMITIVGIYLNNRNVNIGLHYQTSLVVIMFLYLGQCFKLYGQNYIKPNIKISLLVLSFVSLIIYKVPGQVELSANNLWNPLLFYGLSTLMIYVIYTLSSYINKYIAVLTKVLSYIGKNTIVIMCLHILFFKLFDYLYINLITHEYDKLGMFTCSYKNLWVIYSILGVVGPLLINYLVKKTGDIYNLKIKHTRS